MIEDVASSYVCQSELISVKNDALNGTEKAIHSASTSMHTSHTSLNLLWYDIRGRNRTQLRLGSAILYSPMLPPC